MQPYWVWGSRFPLCQQRFCFHYLQKEPQVLLGAPLATPPPPAELRAERDRHAMGLCWSQPETSLPQPRAVPATDFVACNNLTELQTKLKMGTMKADTAADSFWNWKYLTLPLTLPSTSPPQTMGTTLEADLPVTPQPSTWAQAVSQQELHLVTITAM